MRRAVVLASLWLIGCDSDAAAPDGSTISLTVVSGSGQSGMVGTELPGALRAHAMRSRSHLALCASCG